MRPHRHHFCIGADADYIVLESLTPIQAFDGYVVGYQWTEHTRWMIPGTQLED